MVQSVSDDNELMMVVIGSGDVGSAGLVVMVGDDDSVS